MLLNTLKKKKKTTHFHSNQRNHLRLLGLPEASKSRAGGMKTHPNPSASSHSKSGSLTHCLSKPEGKTACLFRFLFLRQTHSFVEAKPENLGKPYRRTLRNPKKRERNPKKPRKTPIVFGSSLGPHPPSRSMKLNKYLLRATQLVDRNAGV